MGINKEEGVEEDYLLDQIKYNLEILQQQGDLYEWYLPEVNDQMVEIPVELMLPELVQATLSIARVNEDNNDTICLLVSGEDNCIDPILLFPNDDQLWGNLLNSIQQYEQYLNE